MIPAEQQAGSAVEELRPGPIHLDELLACIAQADFEALHAALLEAYQRAASIVIVADLRCAAIARQFAGDLSRGMPGGTSVYVWAAEARPDPGAGYIPLSNEQLGSLWSPAMLLVVICLEDSSCDLLTVVEDAVSAGVHTVVLTSGHDQRIVDACGAALIVPGYDGGQILAAYAVICCTLAVTPRLMMATMQDSNSVIAARYNIYKRLLDIVVAGVACIVLSPLALVIALAIKRDDGGPIIYRRRVIGLQGMEFDAFKFRTMIVNADAYLERHPEYLQRYLENVKLADDPRVTRLGHYLRRSSLDELPQFINVLRGEMSLVGPRMIHRSEALRYGPHLVERLSVRPGITGLWQVSGRGSLSYVERVRLDLSYVRRHSMLTDLAILVRTIPAVLSRHGAY